MKTKNKKEYTEGEKKKILNDPNITHYANPNLWAEMFSQGKNLFKDLKIEKNKKKILEANINKRMKELGLDPDKNISEYYRIRQEEGDRLKN